MSAREVIHRARAAGVRLSVNRARIHYQVAERPLQAELREELSTHRVEVLRTLAAEARGWSEEDLADLHAERAGIRQQSGQFSRMTAERLGWLDVDRMLGIVEEGPLLWERTAAMAFFDAEQINPATTVQAVEIPRADEWAYVLRYALQESGRFPAATPRHSPEEPEHGTCSEAPL